VARAIKQENIFKGMPTYRHGKEQTYPNDTLFDFSVFFERYYQQIKILQQG